MLYFLNVPGCNWLSFFLSCFFFILFFYWNPFRISRHSIIQRILRFLSCLLLLSFKLKKGRYGRLPPPLYGNFTPIKSPKRTEIRCNLKKNKSKLVQYDGLFVPFLVIFSKQIENLFNISYPHFNRQICTFLTLRMGFSQNVYNILRGSN